MLSNEDLEFIKESREEIRTNREQDVIVEVRKNLGNHPVTDEPRYEVVEEVLPSVVTIVTVGNTNLGNTNELIGGIKVVTGDIIVDVSLDDLPEDLLVEEVDAVFFRDVKYKVVSYGILGLGYSNRLELLARREF